MTSYGPIQPVRAQGASVRLRRFGYGPLGRKWGAVCLVLLLCELMVLGQVEHLTRPVRGSAFSPISLQDGTGALLATNLQALGRYKAAGGTNWAALSASPMAEKMDSLDDKHPLTIGDRLSFRIAEDQEEPKPLVVTDSGDLEVPYLGRFPAENKTCKQLARELKVALEKRYYYQATVIIAVDQMAKSRGKVYLVGAVHVPGPQEIPGDEALTLSKAILRAGGFNDFADRHNVKLTRKRRAAASETTTVVVDVGLIFDKGKLDLDVPLQPDDLILIPERLIRF